MAFSSVMFENTVKQMKTAPVGFSWTTLFFGFWPALIRGDWKWAVIQFALSIATFGVSVVVFPFIYNKLYIKDLIGNGFRATGCMTGNLDFASAKLGFKIPEFEK